jgi:alkylation response protein AidB-like acyl-CoA dehydrogenase
MIWARDVADNLVKGFIVENKTTPGFSVEKIGHKIALNVVQKGQITLKDVRISEASRLQGGNSFRDTVRVLRMTRYMVGWPRPASRWARASSIVTMTGRGF